MISRTFAINELSCNTKSLSRRSMLILARLINFIFIVVLLVNVKLVKLIIINIMSRNKPKEERKC